MKQNHFTNMTCKETLLNYINANEGWHKKVHLYVIAEDYSPETVGRDLRTLAEENKIEKGEYDGKITKGLAMYSKKGTQKPQPPKFTIVEINGERKAVLVK